MAAVIETCEKGMTELVTTHYYKTSYEKLKQTYIKVLDKLGFNLLSVNDSYTEVFAEKGRITVTAKIIEKNPRETAIDFYIDAEYLLFASKKCVTFLGNVYELLGQELELKGLGLHK